METMTISQALRRIKKLKGELKTHQDRSLASAVYKEGEEPAFEFDKSLNALADTRNLLLHLEAAVAVANAANKITLTGKARNPDGSIVDTTRQVTLAFAIRALQELKAEIAFFQSLPTKVLPKAEITERERNYDDDGKIRMIETKYTQICKLPEANKAATVAALQARFDEINDSLETANHKTPVEIES